jgi:hypothetical protein
VLNQADLRSIHRYSSNHRDLLTRSERAACFSCGAVFSPAEIERWIDSPQDDDTEREGGITALCPRCGIDAVLPSAAPVDLTPALIAEMRRFWFAQ